MRSGQLEKHKALYKGTEISYWDFGLSGTGTAILYRAIHGFGDDGGPLFVDGQDSVVGTVPGDAAYSDFGNVLYYVVDIDFVAGSATSVSNILDAGYRVIEPELIVNCPLVEGDARAGAVELHPGWHDGERVQYFNFGRDQVRDRGSDANIYIFVDGFSASGAPQVSAAMSPVLDSKKGDTNYSALRHVNYVATAAGDDAESIRSEADVRTSGLEIRPANAFMNLPEADDSSSGPPGGFWWALPRAFLLLATALIIREWRRITSLEAISAA